MAKKAKKAKKAKTKKAWTADQILADWKKSLKVGLGASKKLGKSTIDEYEPKLLKKIQQRLDEGRDYNKEGADTRAVATVVGRFSAALTAGNEVPKHVFDEVFDTCQLHPRCPGGGGAGKWCDV